MQLSKDFTLEEFTRSYIADKYDIPNIPDVINIRNITYLTNAILQPLRDYTNAPLVITSGYRCHELNSHRDVNGEENSHHMALDRYAAADVKSKRYTPRQLVDIIAKLKLPVEQAIDEFGLWLHVSSCRPSMEYLKATRNEMFQNTYEVIKYAS